MGGRLHPEWWQVCPGISGRVGPEYASQCQNSAAQKPPRLALFPRTTAAAERRTLLSHRYARCPTFAAALHRAVAGFEPGVHHQWRRPLGCRLFIAEISTHPAVPPLSFARQQPEAR